MVPASAALDLRTLPLSAAAAGLRAWAGDALPALLAGRKLPVPTRRQRRALAPLLRPPRLGEAATARARAALSRHRRLAGGTPPTDDLSLLIGASMAAAPWPARQAQRFRRPAVYVPPALWELLGEAAWSAPLWCRDIAARVRDHLGERLLFRAGELPVARPEARFYWALLAVALDGEAEGDGAALRRIAARLAIAPGWAGFWDQWLLLHLHSVHLHGGDAGHPAAPEVRTLLERIAALPLALMGTADRPAPTRPARPSAPLADAGVPLARASWRGEMPSWMARTVGVSASPAPMGRAG